MRCLNIRVRAALERVTAQEVVGRHSALKPVRGEYGSLLSRVTGMSATVSVGDDQSDWAIMNLLLPLSQPQADVDVGLRTVAIACINADALDV